MLMISSCIFSSIAWALVLQTMKGEKMPDYLPPNWVELFKNETGGRILLTLPDEMPIIEDKERKRICQELTDTLAGLKGDTIRS